MNAEQRQALWNCNYVVPVQEVNGRSHQRANRDRMKYVPRSETKGVIE